jgi:hypothetical protein
MAESVGSGLSRSNRAIVLADTSVGIGNRGVGLWELMVVCGIGKPRAEPDVARTNNNK